MNLPTNRRSLPVIFLFLVWLLLIFIVNPIGDFPLNDDWRYAFPVKSLFENGYLAVSDDFAPSIILQVLWGALFCWFNDEFSFTILRFSTLILGFAGSYFFYRMLCTLGANVKSAFFGALFLTLHPLYFQLSFSFMTDVPFACFCLICLLMFWKYIKTEKDIWIIGLAISSAAAFYIRQPGILFLAILIAYLSLNFSKNKVKILLLLVFSVLLYLSFDKIIKPMLGEEEAFVPVTQLFFDVFIEKPLPFLLEIVKKTVKTIIYLGFFSLPLLPLLWKNIKRTGILRLKFLLPVLLFNIGLLYFLHHINKIFPFGGNILFNLGLGPELLTDIYTLELDNSVKLADYWMYIFNFIGQIAGSLILLFMMKSFSELSDEKRKFFVFVLFLNVLYLPLMSITSFFDRYLLLTFISFWLYLFLFIDFDLSKRKVSFFIPLMLLISYLSIGGTTDYLAWHRTKSVVYEKLLSQNIPLTEIDAGFELNSWNNFQRGFKSPEGKSFWWVNDDKYMITFGEVEGYKIMDKETWFSWLALQDREILLLKRVEKK